MAFNPNRKLAPEKEFSDTRKTEVLEITKKKNARKLYSDSTFTISKLADRSKKSMKEVDALTAMRSEIEQHHAAFAPDAKEIAQVENLNEQINIKLNKALGELYAMQAAQSELSTKLGDLGVVSDHPMRKLLLEKQTATNLFTSKYAFQLNQPHQDRKNEIAKKLRPPQAPPAPRPVDRPKQPVTETLGAEDPSAREDASYTVGEQEEYNKAFDAAHAMDQEGVITPEMVAAGIAKADAEDYAEIVAAARTQDELAAKLKAGATTRHITTPSGESLVHVATSKEPYNVLPGEAGEFEHETILRLVNEAQKTKETALSKRAHDLWEAGTPLLIKRTSGESNRGGVITNIYNDKADVTWINPETNTPLSKRVKIADLLSWQNEEPHSPKAVEASSKSERPEQGENIALKKRVIDLMEAKTPIIIKRSSGESNPGGRIIDYNSDAEEAYVAWPDPETNKLLYKHVKAVDLLKWQTEGQKTPEAKVDKKAFFNKIAVQMDSISERINNISAASILNMDDLRETLNNEGLRSAMNELLDPKDHEKNISELVGTKGIFGFGKGKFDKAAAIKYFTNLSNKALERAASIPDSESGPATVATRQNVLGDNSPINRRPSGPTNPRGLV